MRSDLVPSALTRRDFVRGSLATVSLAACGVFEPDAPKYDPASGHLTARPVTNPSAPRQPLAPGLTALDLDVPQPVLFHVPAGYTHDRAWPLAVALHGAGQTSRTGIQPLLAQADALGFLLVAPQAVGTTWDFIWGPYGPDVANLDRVLAAVFARANVDPSRLALTGFSDGASYALSLGATNGDLFTRLVGFSPGLFAPAARRGKPAVYVSHGTRDGVLNIDRASRSFVPKLEKDGYPVTYREFDGGHQVPADIAAEAAAFVVRA